MEKRLSHKEKGFIRDIIKGETGTRAALNNYDTTDYKTAGVIASENLAKPRIQNAIKSIAESIPDELLVEKHLQLLNSKIGEDKIDVQGVKAGLDMAYKLKSSYAPEKSVQEIHINTLTQEEKQALLDLIQ